MFANKIRKIDVAERPLTIQTAYMCLDCESVFSRRGDCCPNCASAAIHPLGSWVRSTRRVTEARRIPAEVAA